MQDLLSRVWAFTIQRFAIGQLPRRYMAEYPIANTYTGSRLNRIYGGTRVMKEIISRSL
jgi:alkylation response protein AidB-like acyl-CoA dehydrogenase